MIPQEKIQEIQILEQNLQSLLLQKQAFQLELNETDSALSELAESNDEVYKITGQILIKTNKEQLNQELEEKKKLIQLRLTSIENQEKFINQKVEQIRQSKTLKNSKNK